MRLAERLAEQPLASIPGACRGWAETQAAYRFFADDEIGWQDILPPHWRCAEQRMAQHPVVWCLQDTTELDFNGQSILGLGRLSYEAQRGMYLHPTYAVTPDREPLGVLDAWMWARAEKGSAQAAEAVTESTRWREGYERVAERAAALPQTRLVYVADREGDILELMQQAQALNHPADWLIRSQHNRKLPKGGKLWDRVTAGEPLGQIRLTLAARPGQPAREVRQTVWARRIELADGLEVTGVVAKQCQPSAGIKAVEWRVLSNRDGVDFAAAVQLIDWYRARWEIELLFHVVKNACRVEALQLSTLARLERALALFLVVAWRIARLMRLGRACPDLPAGLFFEPEAMLGGFLGRKGDSEPGVKTLWWGCNGSPTSPQDCATHARRGHLRSV